MATITDFPTKDQIDAIAKKIGLVSTATPTPAQRQWVVEALQRYDEVAAGTKLVAIAQAKPA